MMGAGFPTTIRLGPWRCKLVWVAVPIIVFIAVQLLTAFVIMSPQPAPTSSALAETATATAKATTGAAAAGAESPHIVQSSLDQRPVAVSSRKTRKDGTSSEVQQPGSRHAVKDASAAPAAPAAKPQLPPPSPSPPASPRAPAAAAEDTGGDAGKSSKNKKPGVEDDDFDDDDDGRMLQTSPLPVNVAAGRRCFDVNRTLPLDVSCFDDGRAPHGRPRCVCRDNSNTFSLLPSFFVIGAQKSGTTALMGLFLFHPKFVHMRAKEGHFFDRYEGAKPKHQKERARRWYRLMPRAPMDRSVFTGEGTPAYILSASPARLMHQYLPDAKHIALLRDPVARTESEYNMKLRRIAAAMDVRDASTRAALIAAINTCTPVQYVADDELHECLFTHMQDVPGFLAAVHSIKRNLGLFKCITTQLRREQQPVTVDSAGGQNVLRCFEHVPRETVPPPEMMFKLDMDCIDASMMLRTDVDIPPSSSCYDVAMALAQRVGQAGHGDGGGGGGGDHRAPPRQPSSDSLLQEFSDDLFVHAVILQQAEGVFDALPSNATLDSNVVNRLCLTIEECLRTTAASSTWPEACPDELESELAASVRGVMVKHLGSPVAACRARALQDIDSLLYDEMVFNKVIEQVDRSYQKEMAELRVAQAELLREETSLTKERRATMDKLSQDRQQRLQSLISASSKGDDDDDRGRDGGDVHGAPPLHYLPTLHDDDDGGRGSHGDNRGRTGADDGDEDGEEEEEADVAALHDLLFSQMLGAATAASADMGEGSHVITPDEFMTQHIQLPADGSGDDTRVHVNGRRVPQQPATDDAFVESSSSSSSSSPATAASVSPSTTAGTTTEPRPDEQGSSNARESGDGEAADADGEDADTPSDSRAEAETGEEDQEGGGDDDSEVVVVTADVEDDDFDHDMTVISARLSDAGLVSPQADGDGGDYDDEEEDGEEDEEDELVNGCQREAMAKYMFAMSELGEEESGADDTSGSPVLQQRHMNCDYRNTADDAQLHDLFAKIDAAAVEDDASAVHEAELTPDTLATPTDF